MTTEMFTHTRDMKEHAFPAIEAFIHALMVKQASIPYRREQWALRARFGEAILRADHALQELEATVALWQV